MTHELKIAPAYFQALMDGTKTDELRREDDRTFAVGDVLVLREWKPELTVYGMDGWDALQAAKDTEAAETLKKHLDARGYTGRTLTREVTYVLRDPEHRWLQPGVVALSLRKVEEAET